ARNCPISPGSYRGSRGSSAVSAATSSRCIISGCSTTPPSSAPSSTSSSRRRTAVTSSRSSTRWSPPASPPACCRAARTWLNPIPPALRADWRDQHAVDAAAIHLDDLEAPITGGDSVRDHRHAIEPRHQIPAEGMEIGILARQLRDPEHLFELVEPDHAVDQPGAVLPLDNAGIGLARLRQFADQRFQEA